MIIVFKPGATQEEVDRVVQRLREIGMTPHLSRGVSRTICGAIGNERVLDQHPLDAFEGIERIIPIMAPYKLASREFKRDDTIVDVGGVEVGGDRFTIMAGPCAVESREQVLHLAEFLAKNGVRIFRGGAFKPRSSPYAFQGLGVEGLEILSEARERTGLKIVTEVLDAQTADVVAAHADILQIGARNMQNFALLKKCGRMDKAILLKRGMSATIHELLLAAEYLLMEGNHRVILCERGIKTFETATRSTLDISAVPIVKRESHLPILVDPSHSSGMRDIIPALSRAAVAAGADGIIVEVHHQPEKALCDGQQALREPDLVRVLDEVRRIALAMGRQIG